MTGSPKDMYIGFAAIVVMPALFTVLVFPPIPLVGPLLLCMPSRFRSAPVVPNPKSSPPEKGSSEEVGRLCPSPNAPGEERKREEEGSEEADASLDNELLLPFTWLTLAPGRAEELELTEGRAKREDCGGLLVLLSLVVFSGVEASEELGEDIFGEGTLPPRFAALGPAAEEGEALALAPALEPEGKLKVKADCLRRRFSFCSRPRRSRRFSFSRSWLFERASSAATWSSSCVAQTGRGTGAIRIWSDDDKEKATDLFDVLLLALAEGSLGGPVLLFALQRAVLIL